MKREGWEGLLEDYLHKMRRRLFRWGKLDCALFGADWAVIATGKDPAAGSRGEYKTKAGATAHLAEKYGDIYKAFDAHFQRVQPAFRQRGDLALCDVDGMETIGIVSGGSLIFFKAMGKGIIARKAPPILAVWKVE